jgi:hypothetical protein
VGVTGVGAGAEALTGQPQWAAHSARRSAGISGKQKSKSAAEALLGSQQWSMG